MPKFELRACIVEKERETLRLCLLPHGENGTEDLPWSRTNTPPAIEEVLAPDAPPPPDEATRSELWLPAYGTRLTLNGVPPALEPVFRDRQRLSLQRDAAAAGPAKYQPKVRPASGDPGAPGEPADGNAALVCYGGLRAMRAAPAPEEKAQALADSRTHRHAKLTLLQIIEAWRYPGSLEEYSQIGPGELMAGLSHLVFDLKLGSATAARNALKEWRDAKCTVTVEQPVELTAPDTDETLHPESAPVPPEGHPVAAILPGENPPVVRVLRVDVSQRAEGIFFELVDPEGNHAFEWLTNPTTPIDQCKLLLGRSSGAVPMAEPPVVAASYLGLAVSGFELEDGTLVSPPGERRPLRIADHLAPDSFAGEQLNYELRILNQFGQPIAAVAVPLLRERFDPPPVASEPVARMVFPDAGPCTLVIEAHYPGLENQLPRHLNIPAAGRLTEAQAEEAREHIAKAFHAELFLQERRLDECGFYGDDDDIALLEGLRQADPSFDPRAEADQSSPLAGDPLEEYLRGRFDREGLTEAPVPAPVWEWIEAKKEEKADTPPKRRSLRLRWEIPVEKPGESPAWFRALRGYHFHVGLRRDGITNREVRAALAACRHELCIGGVPVSDPEAGGEKIGDQPHSRTSVFQLEWFAAPTLEHDIAEGSRRFLRHDRFHLALLERSEQSAEMPRETHRRQDRVDAIREREPGDLPLGVQLVYSHPVLGSAEFADAAVPPGPDTAPIGGVRILVRDQAARGQALPFRVADTVQALPRAVALYRPVQIEAGLDAFAVELSRLGLSSDVQPATVLGEAVPSAVDDWHGLTGLAELAGDVVALRVLAPGGLVERLRVAMGKFCGGAEGAFRLRGWTSPPEPAPVPLDATAVPDALARLQKQDGARAKDDDALAAQVRDWLELSSRVAEPAAQATLAQAFSAGPGQRLPHRIAQLRADTAGDVEVRSRAWAELLAAAELAAKGGGVPAESLPERIFAGFRETLGPTLTEAWNTWRDAAQKRLALDASQLKAGDLLDAQGEPKPAAAAAWHLLGPLVSALREIGLAQDAVVKLAHAEKVWSSVATALAQPWATDLPRLRVLGLETADGRDTMATVRLVFLPRRALLTALFGGDRGKENEPPSSDAQRRLRLFEAVARGLATEVTSAGPAPQTTRTSVLSLKLRDATRTPLNLAIREGRLVRYTWRGLHDFWHHDLDFAVQLLDRYHRVREFYQRSLLDHAIRLAEEELRKREQAGDTAARLKEAEEARQTLLGRRAARADEAESALGARIEVAPGEAIRAIVAPRREPLAGHPGVLPAFFRPDWVVAFEVQDSEERQKATHNILTRTRYGHIEAQWALRGTFVPAGLYPAALGSRREAAAGAEFAGWWKTEREKSINTLGGSSTAKRALRVRLHGSSGEASRLVWKKANSETAVGDDDDARIPIPPRPGCDVVAYPGQPYFIQHRLDCWHIADFVQSRAAHAQVDRLPLRLSLPALPKYQFSQDVSKLDIHFVPPALADHMTSKEHDTFRKDPLAGDLAAHLSLAPGTAPAQAQLWAVRLDELPDLEIELTFYLNFETGAGPLKLRPLVRWWRDPASSLPDAQATPLGFTPVEIDPVVTPGSVGCRWDQPALIVLTATLVDTLETNLRAALTAKGPNRLFVSLRRGRLTTDLLPLLAFA